MCGQFFFIDHIVGDLSQILLWDILGTRLARSPKNCRPQRTTGTRLFAGSGQIEPSYLGGAQAPIPAEGFPMGHLGISLELVYGERMRKESSETHGFL